jgi:hypothetical protein|tara:strand:+ start:533 stop:985 length:453 start_codon:yes stop_codon:yes gene_type:complete
MIPTEIIETMKKTPSKLAHLIAEAKDTQLDAADGDNWSARTVLAHLRDAEMYEFRLSVERLIAEDNPELYFLNPQKWESQRTFHRDLKEQILGDFALQRQASISLLQSLVQEQCLQQGTLNEEEINVLTIVDWWNHHDIAHIEQIQKSIT